MGGNITLGAPLKTEGTT